MGALSTRSTFAASIGLSVSAHLGLFGSPPPCNISTTRPPRPPFASLGRTQRSWGRKKKEKRRKKKGKNFCSTEKPRETGRRRPRFALGLSRVACGFRAGLWASMEKKKKRTSVLAQKDRRVGAHGKKKVSRGGKGRHVGPPFRRHGSALARFLLLGRCVSPFPFFPLVFFRLCPPRKKSTLGKGGGKEQREKNPRKEDGGDAAAFFLFSCHARFQVRLVHLVMDDGPARWGATSVQLGHQGPAPTVDDGGHVPDAVTHLGVKLRHLRVVGALCRQLGELVARFLDRPAVYVEHVELVLDLRRRKSGRRFGRRRRKARLFDGALLGEDLLCGRPADVCVWFVHGVEDGPRVCAASLATRAHAGTQADV